MKRNIFLTGWMTIIAVILSALAAITGNPPSFLLKFVDSMFYIALPLVIVGGFLFLIERGFFNVTRYAFRKAFKVQNNKMASLIEEEESRSFDDKDVLYRTYSFRFTYPILLTGIILAVVSTVISFAVFV
ncbi:MAG: DUF3899 domain-containing protein [Ectobacillus sp.]